MAVRDAPQDTVPPPREAYPAPPWRIAGPAAIVPVPVPLATARRLLPPDVAVVPVAPGRTVGGLLIARYTAPSTLSYGELLVMPALTALRGGVGWWVSHAYVDSEASLRGGRELWGVPKALATFAWRADGVRVVAADGAGGGGLLDATFAAPGRTAPLPAVVSVNGTTGGADRRRFVGAGLLRLAPVRMALDVPPDSPLAALPLAGRRVALAGTADLRLRRPRVLA
jgi:hypothetical protein